MILILMFTIHLVADFFMQSREMGTKKSSDLKWLFRHIAIITGMFTVCLCPVMGVNGLYFALLNGLIHMVIDWNIWKIYKWDVKRRLNEQLFAIIENSKRKFYTSWITNPENLEEFKRTNFARLIETFKFWEDSRFFDTIGVDQYLHAITIVGLAYAFGVIR